jgi:hypothetical protein
MKPEGSAAYLAREAVVIGSGKRVRGNVPCDERVSVMSGLVISAVAGSTSAIIVDYPWLVAGKKAISTRSGCKVSTIFFNSD